MIVKSYDETMALLRADKINNGFTVLALYWLAANRDGCAALALIPPPGQGQARATAAAAADSRGSPSSNSRVYASAAPCSARKSSTASSSTMRPSRITRDAVAELRDDGEIVADQHIGQPALAAQPLQQGDDLGLDGDVERRRRLVEQQQRRLENERARDRHALALPARELMRIAEAVRGIEPDRAQRGGDAPGGVADAVDSQRLGERAVDGVARMERAVRVLEHHLDAAAMRAMASLRCAIEHQRARPFRVQPGDDAQQRRLARAGFADDAERLARCHREGDAVDHRRRAEARGQRARLDHDAASRGRAASRRRV